MSSALKNIFLYYAVLTSYNTTTLSTLSIKRNEITVRCENV